MPLPALALPAIGAFLGGVALSDMPVIGGILGSGGNQGGGGSNVVIMIVVALLVAMLAGGLGYVSGAD